MALRFYDRLEIQNILEKNNLNAPVFYKDRQDNTSLDNYIIYYLETNQTPIYADNVLHIDTIGLRIAHLHKKKLDNIFGLMKEELQIRPFLFLHKDVDNDYFTDYYTLNIMFNAESGGW